MTKKRYKTIISMFFVIWLITSCFLLLKTNIVENIQNTYLAYTCLNEIKINKISIAKSNDKKFNKEISVTFNSIADKNKFDELTKKIMHPNKKSDSKLSVLCLIINQTSIGVLIIFLIIGIRDYKNMPEY